MQEKSEPRLLRALVYGICAVALIGAKQLCIAQQGSAPVPAPSSVQLQPYTAPDQSASAGVPPGWKVTSGAQTVIQMTGSQGDEIILGKTFIARNASFAAGQRGTGGTDLSMPFSANLEQKLAMILEQGAALGGMPAPQVSFTSATPLQLPPALGQCGRFVLNATSTRGPLMMMGVFCSLPLDSGGVFKNILIEAQAPAAIAQKDAAIASAVFSSYKIPTAMLKKKLAPFNAPPIAVPNAGGAKPGPGSMPMMDDTSADCFDLSVIRELPPSQLPQKCGGRLPN